MEKQVENVLGKALIYIEENRCYDEQTVYKYLYPDIVDDHDIVDIVLAKLNCRGILKTEKEQVLEILYGKR